jgi:hypothetical protein
MFFNHLTVAVLALASTTLACVDYAVDINQDEYAAATLKDNGVLICSYNGYGDNTGYSKSTDC